MSGTTPPPDHSGAAPGGDPAQAASAEALRAAFARLAPQGSDAWNFLAAFTHLGNRFGPYQPGASDLAEQLMPQKGGVRRGRKGSPAPEEKSEFEEAMGHVIEAFRFLSARVLTLEERLAREDGPIDGMAWLTSAADLGAWVTPVVEHIVRSAPGGEVLHGDCGQGELLAALDGAGLRARGCEPRGGVALGALEAGHSVVICDVADEVAACPPRSLGGLVLSGVVDRLPLHALVDLLAGSGRALAAGAPVVIVSTEPAAIPAAWDTVARDIVGARPLHEQTWALLLDRAGFVDIAALAGPAEEGRFAVTASMSR